MKTSEKEHLLLIEEIQEDKAIEEEFNDFFSVFVKKYNFPEEGYRDIRFLVASYLNMRRYKLSMLYPDARKLKG